MIEPGINMRRRYPQDPDNYQVTSSWRQIDEIAAELQKLSKTTIDDNNYKTMSPDAARLIMDNTLVICELLDIMTRTIKSQLR